MVRVRHHIWGRGQGWGGTGCQRGTGSLGRFCIQNADLQVEWACCCYAQLLWPHVGPPRIRATLDRLSVPSSSIPWPWSPKHPGSSAQRNISSSRSQSEELRQDRPHIAKRRWWAAHCRGTLQCAPAAPPRADGQRHMAVAPAPKLQSAHGWQRHPAAAAPPPELPSAHSSVQRHTAAAPCNDTSTQALIRTHLQRHQQPNSKTHTGSSSYN